MIDLYKANAGDINGLEISVSSRKKKYPVGQEFDEGVEGVDWKYDKHGNKWAIIKPENSPKRQYEYRDGKYFNEKNKVEPKKDSSILDYYDAGMFAKKRK